MVAAETKKRRQHAWIALAAEQPILPVRRKSRRRPRRSGQMTAGSTIFHKSPRPPKPTSRMAQFALQGHGKVILNAWQYQPRQGSSDMKMKRRAALLLPVAVIAAVIVAASGAASAQTSDDLRQC